MQLVTALTEQLGGEVHTEDAQGARFVVTFPKH
jgi:two-component sensor histidine kinase